MTPSEGSLRGGFSPGSACADPPRQESPRGSDLVSAASPTWSHRRSTRMRKALFLGFAAALLTAPFALAQPGAPPCPVGATVSGYRCDPVPNGFSSIVGLVGTVNVFLPATDDTTTPAIPFPAGFAFTYYGVAKASVSIC